MNKWNPESLLKEVEKEFPHVWKQAEILRGTKGGKEKDWPNWCFLPTSVSCTIVHPSNNPSKKMTYEEVATWLMFMHFAIPWRLGKGVYHFDNELTTALKKTDLRTKIPLECLTQMPEWCFYIDNEHDSEDNFIDGAFVALDYDCDTDRKTLRILLCDHRTKFKYIPITLHLVHPTIDENLEVYMLEVEKEWRRNKKDLNDQDLNYLERTKSYLKDGLLAILPFILYLCSENADIMPNKPCAVNKPSYPSPVKTKEGLRYFAASNKREWVIGKKIGDQLRELKQKSETEKNDSNSKTPHLRRAHFHHYWTGKRKTELTLKWIYPILVGRKEKGDSCE